MENLGQLQNLSWGNGLMNKPLVDIIIPAYNSHRTINRAIDSILQCGDIDYHITIVNDAGEPYNITNIDCLTELTNEKNSCTNSTNSIHMSYGRNSICY